MGEQEDLLKGKYINWDKYKTIRVASAISTINQENSLLGLHTAKGEAVRYHNRYQRNDTVF